MATMFGRFEIQSELSKSDTALIYKATDLKTEQVVALKTQSLERLGDRKDAFVNALLEEGEASRDLINQNIVALYGAGEIEGQFCAAMEYIQGNSIGTMLARNEGFSIWDLLDITRQISAGLEHAAAKGVAHSSLEPDKIMVQWDGMVKILGYGISNMSLIEAESGRGLGRLMSYCSPEQLRGEAIDLRSNLFTLGTILYEMVVGQRAFDGTDPIALVSQIENEMPPAPATLNAKIHPAMSELIMKALAKDPAERYQSGRELLEDLEKCKESKKAATDSPKPAAMANTAVSRAARAAAVSKFVASSSPSSSSPSSASTTTAVPRSDTVGLSKPVPHDPVAAVSPRIAAPESSRPRPVAKGNAAAAAAGVDASEHASGFSNSALDLTAEADHPDSRVHSNQGSKSDSTDHSDSAARMISDFQVQAPESSSSEVCGPVLSAAAVEEEPQTYSPRVAVDPFMSEPVAASPAKSFSDLAEMPPLKEPVIDTSFTVPETPLPSVAKIDSGKISPGKEEKPGIQLREVAEKALQQIATIPARLMLYSLLGAVGLLLVVAMAVYFHVRSEDDGSTSAPQPVAAKATSTETQPVAQAPMPSRPGKAVAAPVEAQPQLAVRPVQKRSSKTTLREPVPAPAPVVIAGEAFIDSSPQGASFQVDGQSDPSWITPFTVTGLSAGKHIVSVTKSGYSSDIRSVEVTSGSKSSLVLHLAPVNASMVVNSTPPGADIIVDGKPIGRVTPAQFAVEKGSHTILLRKHGYLDENTTAELGPAQNFQYAPVLKALGNTENMRPLGAFNRLFGRGGENAAGMGSILVRTQPKGAQVAINQQVLERTAPVGVALDPGNYIVDITLTGFKPIHKVVTVDRGNRAVIDETLERQ